MSIDQDASSLKKRASAVSRMSWQSIQLDRKLRQHHVRGLTVFAESDVRFLITIVAILTWSSTGYDIKEGVMLCITSRPDHLMNHYFSFFAFSSVLLLQLCWATGLVVHPCCIACAVAATGVHKWHTDNHSEVSQPLYIFMHVYIRAALLYLSNQNLRGALSPQISLSTRFWSLDTCNNTAEARFLLFISLSCPTIVDSWVNQGWCGAGCSGWRPWPLH